MGRLQEDVQRAPSDLPGSAARRRVLRPLPRGKRRRFVAPVFGTGPEGRRRGGGRGAGTASPMALAADLAQPAERAGERLNSMGTITSF